MGRKGMALAGAAAMALLATAGATQTLRSQSAQLTRPATATQAQSGQSQNGQSMQGQSMAGQRAQAQGLTQGAATPGGRLTGTQRGALTDGDAGLDSGEKEDVWTLPVRRGQHYEVTAQSSDFDPYLMVRGPGGLQDDNDDDPGRRGATDSRLSFTAPADGEAQIHVTSYQAGERGTYVVRLESGAAATQVAQQPASRPDGALTLGQSVQGRLQSGDGQLSSGEFADTYVLRGRRGQALDLRLTSGEFDPYVQVSGPGGLSAYNDDDPAGNGGHDSRLGVTLPADGDVTVTVTSYEPGEAGRYVLSVGAGSAASAPPEPASRPSERAGPGGTIGLGQTVAGALAAGDETLSSGEYVDEYRFTGRRGQRIQADLSSSAFDAYLMLRSPSGDQRDNDDANAENGHDSRLEMALPEDGEYVLSVTSYRPGETGSYRFSLSPSQGSPRQASVQGGARIFAVMVGIADYGDPGSNLEYTDDDARKLAETLEHEGALNDASVVLTNAEATVAGVRAAFNRVAQQAGPNDLFLFFYSGHGGQHDTPVSGLEPDGKTETIVLRDGEITDAEMATLYGRLHTRLAMLVLDSCFSGGFARNVVDRPGVMGVFSSEEDLTSAVADKFQAGGYLSHFLRVGMAGEADADGDRLVTAGELAAYLRRQFRTQVEAVESETADGQRNYQNLVVDRGGVQVDDVILRLPASAQAAGAQ